MDMATVLSWLQGRFRTDYNPSSLLPFLLLILLLLLSASIKRRYMMQSGAPYRIGICCYNVE
jgi:hypothetical protein